MTGHADNPYGDSLAGLEIRDPVKAFFDWCIEREAIRRRRASGELPPWSHDPVFQKGRFLNVFREDDKGTQAVLRFAASARESVPDLIHALFFARWCNQYTTLVCLKPDLLKRPRDLRCALTSQVPQPWASEVYPVVPAQWKGNEYDRLEACVEMLPLCLGFLTDCVRASQGNVMDAQERINSRFMMSNDFPIFMALVDVALFQPDLIRPDSAVPTGIGAAPYLDLLQRHLKCSNHQEVAAKMIELQDTYWPVARRRFVPIDIEYLSCECRKYFSYVNGTKTFEGKNLFVPCTDTSKEESSP